MTAEGLDRYSTDALLAELARRESQSAPSVLPQTFLGGGNLSAGASGVNLPTTASCPLSVDAEGAVRIGNSRIPLELVVDQYECGMTPEDIVNAYDTLTLANVYGVIAFCLEHREQVQSYVQHRREQADRQRVEIEAKFPPITRQELEARKSDFRQGHAPTRK